VGRLLIALLVEHWNLLPAPLLYLSVAFKRHRPEYYRRLSAVRTEGDWEGWTAFFLACVREAAEDGVEAARRLFACLSEDRRALMGHAATTLPAVRLFDLLPEHPVVTVPTAMEMLGTSKPTAAKAIDAMGRAGILREITGKRRDRVYVYQKYLGILAEDTDIPARPTQREERFSEALRHVHERFGGDMRRLAEGDAGK